MTDAFKCGRCGELTEGEPAAQLQQLGVPAETQTADLCAECLTEIETEWSLWEDEE